MSSLIIGDRIADLHHASTDVEEATNSLRSGSSHSLNSESNGGSESGYETRKQYYLAWFPGIAVEGSAVSSKVQDEERRTTPLVSLDAMMRIQAKHKEEDLFPHHGLLGLTITGNEQINNDEPIFMNTNTPSSAFICGSQGSGKSYTLAAMLENCLSREHTPGQASAAMPGLLFHYDRNGGAAPAEAARLCELSDVKVRVLVSQSSYQRLMPVYTGMKGAGHGKITVEPLLFQDHQLEVDRVLKLMAFSDADVAVPLYMQVLMRLLRERATMGLKVDLAELEKGLGEQGFAASQNVMLGMRLELLKSFCATAVPPFSKRKGKQAHQDAFRLTPGTLTIVDLSDAFIDSSTACTLFSICLGLMTAQKPPGGLVVALDEAHKFINQSPAAEDFIDQILTTIRMQRHYGVRVVVATQEPTISPRLLDLCSVSIVHRFTSPAWFAALKDHLGGASSMTMTTEQQKDLFEHIMELRAGESFVFSPSSFVCMRGGVEQKLGRGFMKMKTRMVTADGGESVLSVERA